MNMPDLAVQAMALTIRHLKQFGFERIIQLGASFRPFSSKLEMTLSGNALQQLEVLDSFNGKFLLITNGIYCLLSPAPNCWQDLISIDIGVMDDGK